MNVACDYEAPMQMLTTEKYIAAGSGLFFRGVRNSITPTPYYRVAWLAQWWYFWKVSNY